MDRFEEVLRLYDEVGGDLVPVWALDSLGDTARRLGDEQRAEEALSDALTHAEAMGDKWTTTFAIGHLGQLELGRGAVEQAALLLATADRLIEKHEVYVDPRFVAEIRAALSQARASLTADRFDQLIATATLAAASETPSSFVEAARRRDEPPQENVSID